MVYTEYIFNTFNRLIVSVAWEMAQVSFDVMCSYTGVFDRGFRGVDFLCGVVYKSVTFWCAGYRVFNILVPCIIKAVDAVYDSI